MSRDWHRYHPEVESVEFLSAGIREALEMTIELAIEDGEVSAASVTAEFVDLHGLRYMQREIYNYVADQLGETK